MFPEISDSEMSYANDKKLKKRIFCDVTLQNGNVTQDNCN